MLERRRRLRANIEPTFGKRLCLMGWLVVGLMLCLIVDGGELRTLFIDHWHFCELPLFSISSIRSTSCVYWVSSNVSMTQTQNLLFVIHVKYNIQNKQQKKCKNYKHMYDRRPSLRSIDRLREVHLVTPKSNSRGW